MLINNLADLILTAPTIEYTVFGNAHYALIFQINLRNEFLQVI